MERGRGFARTLVVLAADLVLSAALVGCAGAINAETVTTMVRARPTIPPGNYALQMDGAVHALQSSLDKLALLLAEPHYFDDAWKSEAVNLATLVELGYRQLEGLVPPDAELAHHAEAVQAMQDCQTLTVYVFQGINNLDKGPFDEVNERVNFCRTKLGVATRAPGSIESRSQPVSLEAARQEVTVRAKRDANLRGGPSTKNPVVATARPGDTFTVTARTAKSDWLQITSDRVKTAWIAAFLVEADGDLNGLSVVDAAAQPAIAANPGNP